MLQLQPKQTMHLDRLWLIADSDWGDDPERFFGHVTVKVDPGDEEEYTPRTQSEKNGDADNDDDSISDVSGIDDDDDDEVPFGPSRTIGGEPGQSKSLEILRGASHHGANNLPGTILAARQYKVNCHVHAAFLVSCLSCHMRQHAILVLVRVKFDILSNMLALQLGCLRHADGLTCGCPISYACSLPLWDRIVSVIWHNLRYFCCPANCQSPFCS